jgi:ERF superfamily
VTCILTHQMGHSEETTLAGAPDNSGSKNSIQAIGSTVTYLERYTLLAATGLAAANGDNDGQGAPKWEKLQEYLDSIATAPNLTVLEQTYKAGFKEAMALQNTQAALMITNAKNERKQILQSEEPA